jgi:hypothetical protein
MLSVDLVNLVKEISQYIERKKAHDPELVSMFMRLNQDIMGLVAENADLMAQVQTLKDKINVEDGLEFNKDVGVWEKETNGSLLRYCPRCKKEGALVPLKEQENGFWCHACELWAKKPGHSESAITVPLRNRFRMDGF